MHQGDKCLKTFESEQNLQVEEGESIDESQSEDNKSSQIRLSEIQIIEEQAAKVAFDNCDFIGDRSQMGENPAPDADH